MLHIFVQWSDRMRGSRWSKRPAPRPVKLSLFWTWLPKSKERTDQLSLLHYANNWQKFDDKSRKTSHFPGIECIAQQNRLTGIGWSRRERWCGALWSDGDWARPREWIARPGTNGKRGSNGSPAVSDNGTKLKYFLKQLCKWTSTFDFLKLDG